MRVCRPTRAAAATCAATTLALVGALPAAQATTAGAPADSPEDPAKVELVLDASGSMAEPTADGTPKIEVARTALRKVVDGLPADAHTGMRVYGATQPGIKDTPKACSDSQQVVPIGTDNKDRLRQEIRRYKPQGQTPTGYALKKAAGDLGDKGPRTIILVSDGKATCDIDPCDVAKTLTKKGINLRIDVVGFKVEDTARTQLQCVAESGGGTYYDATDAEDLTAALKAASISAQAPFHPEGKPVQSAGSKKNAPVLTEGRYLDAMPTENDGERYYRLRHTVPGSTLWIGLVTQMKQSTFSSLDARVEGADGSRCSRAVEIHSKLQALSVTTYEEDEPGCSPQHDQYLVLEGDPEKVDPDQKIQLTVVEEPPASGPHTDPDAESTESPTWKAMPEPGKPEPVDAVASLDEAPTVKPGRYSLKVAPESVALVKVHLDWGQRLQVKASVPADSPIQGDDSDFTVDLLSPLGGSVADHTAHDVPATVPWAYEDRGPSLKPATMHPVDYANRQSDLGWVNGTARTGDYYVAVAREDGSSSDQGVLPVNLQIVTVGDKAKGPTYQDATPTSSATPSSPATSAPTEAPSKDATTEAAGPADQQVEESGPSGTLIAGISVGAVLLAGIGVAATIAARRP